MQDLQTFEFENQGVRTLTIDDEPYFVGKDVANILGYKKARNAIASHVDFDDKKDAPIQGPLGGMQNVTVINESGLYSLIMSSKLPNAKKFKHWVTSEVLPSIRRHGAYLTDQKAIDIMTNKDGQRVYVTEVVVDNFALLEAKPEQQNNVNTSDLKKEDRNSAETNQDIQKDPFEGNGETIDISDDDLPF